MAAYIIVRCLNCGQPLIARAGQKTKVCSYCSRNLDIHRLQVFARVDSARQATRIAIAMKTPRASGVRESEATRP